MRGTLFDPARHEALAGAPWSYEAALAAIARIVADTHAAYRGPDELWQIHPLDVSPERADVLKPLYNGAAGAIWALAQLGEDTSGYVAAFEPMLAAHRADALQLTGSPVRGYLLGEAGILLAQHAIEQPDTLDGELFAVLANNIEHPALGVAWGGAGSMLAALHLFERTNSPRWRDLYLRAFEFLWSRWTYDDAAGCHLWTTRPYDDRDMDLSGLHGSPGIAHAMLRGRAVIGEARWHAVAERARQMLFTTARREGGGANWLLSARHDDGALRVQHCVGAPGLVNSLVALPLDPKTDATLIAAGELIWAAGPVTKLPSLCHGVPGSGYALLKLFARTGDQLWLDRARSFAMHAIAQAGRGVALHGQRKFSLWTGDLGLAVYLQSCINEDARFPTLDYF